MPSQIWDLLKNLLPQKNRQFPPLSKKNNNCRKCPPPRNRLGGCVWTCCISKAILPNGFPDVGVWPSPAIACEKANAALAWWHSSNMQLVVCAWTKLSQNKWSKTTGFWLMVPIIDPLPTDRTDRLTPSAAVVHPQSRISSASSNNDMALGQDSHMCQMLTSFIPNWHFLARHRFDVAIQVNAPPLVFFWSRNLFHGMSQH